MQSAIVYSAEQIEDLALRVAGWQGWDLLMFKMRRAPAPWDMAEIAREHLTGHESVLDAGCGDGRLLTSLAGGIRRGIGIDVSKSRTDRARLSLPMKLRSRIHFTRGSAHAVPAPEATLQVVLSRHAPLFPEEIDRVLSPGGVLVAQQIGADNARALVSEFRESRGSGFTSASIARELGLAEAVKSLVAAGYEVKRREEYDLPIVFEDAASLLFWLQAVPVPHDLEAAKDAATVARIIERLGTPRGIVTNEHRELVVLQKPG